MKNKVKSKIISNNTANLGIGVDIEDIDRFRKLIHNNTTSFYKKILTKHEVAYCFSKYSAVQHIAVRFSAKEAIFKALSSMNKKVAYQGIEILNNKRGVPIARLLNNNFSDLEVKLSISHCKDKVIAFVIIVKKQHRVWPKLKK